jgi:thiamine transporter
MFTAVGLVLDYLAGLYSKVIWENGGSISLAMTAIFIMAYRWGLKGGLTTGLLIGSLQILYSFSGEIVHPLQVFLDYIFAYTSVGFAGMFAKKIAKAEPTGKLYYITMGVILASSIRLLMHIISGWVYFREYIPSEIIESYHWFYWSIIYNMGYMIPSTILSLIPLLIIGRRYPFLIEYEDLKR